MLSSVKAGLAKVIRAKSANCAGIKKMLRCTQICSDVVRGRRPAGRRRPRSLDGAHVGFGGMGADRIVLGQNDSGKAGGKNSLSGRSVSRQPSGVRGLRFGSVVAESCCGQAGAAGDWEGYTPLGVVRAVNPSGPAKDGHSFAIHPSTDPSATVSRAVRWVVQRPRSLNARAQRGQDRQEDIKTT